jgi:uncharacterized protein YggE
MTIHRAVAHAAGVGVFLCAVPGFAAVEITTKGTTTTTSAAPAPPPPPSTVRVTAEAVTRAVPDQAVVQIGITTDSPSAQTAAAENTRKQQSVVQAVQTAVGSAGSIETTQFSLQPRQQFPPQGGNPVVTGYGAQNTVSATVANPSEVGRVIDAALAAGADNIQGVTFSVKNDQPARSEALQKAVARARVEADALAAGLGLKVRRVLTVEEEPAPRPVVAGRTEVPSHAPAAVVPVPPGAIEFHSSVVLTVEVGKE